MPERLASDGGVIISVNSVLSEPVSGPEKPGTLLFYYLEGVGFRLKKFGEAAVDAFRVQGALPGVWRLLASGRTAFGAGETKTLATVTTPVPNQEILMVVASGDGGAVHVFEGTTAAAPGASAVVYDQVGNGADTDIKARSGSGVSAFNLTWAVYKVTLPL